MGLRKGVEAFALFPPRGQLSGTHSGQLKFLVVLLCFCCSGLGDKDAAGLKSDVLNI